MTDVFTRADAEELLFLKNTVKSVIESPPGTDVVTPGGRHLTPFSSLGATDGAVHNSGDENVAGVKNFSSSPIVPDGVSATDAASKGQLDRLSVILPEPKVNNFDLPNTDLALHKKIASMVGHITSPSRRNLAIYTENASNSFWNYGGPTINIDTASTIVISGVTLTKITWHNFYAYLNTNFAGIGYAPFTTGQYYLFSMYALLVDDHIQYPCVSPTEDGSNYFRRKILRPNRLNRVWHLGKALSSSTIDMGSVGTIAFGSGPSSNFWPAVGNMQDCDGDVGSATCIYAGGLQIENVTSDGKYGFSAIGDSTMASSVGPGDNSVGKAWVNMLGARLNVDSFNRAIGGNKTSDMWARYVADISPLAARSKYVIIQPSAPNSIANGETYNDITNYVGYMAGTAVSDGCLPIIVVPAPWNQLTDGNPNQAAWRVIYDNLCIWIRRGFPRVIDVASIVADPANKYQLLPKWRGDGVHFAQATDGTNPHEAIADYAATLTWWDFPQPSEYQPIAAASYP